MFWIGYYLISTTISFVGGLIVSISIEVKEKYNIESGLMKKIGAALFLIGIISFIIITIILGISLINSGL
jgi:hypothetical protein